MADRRCSEGVVGARQAEGASVQEAFRWPRNTHGEFQTPLLAQRRASESARKNLAAVGNSSAGMSLLVSIRIGSLSLEPRPNVELSGRRRLAGGCPLERRVGMVTVAETQAHNEPLR